MVCRTCKLLSALIASWRSTLRRVLQASNLYGNTDCKILTTLFHYTVNQLLIHLISFVGDSLLAYLYILNMVRCSYVRTFVRNAGHGQLSGKWHRIENDVVMRTGAVSAIGEWRHNDNSWLMEIRYGDWWHVAMGCSALVFRKRHVYNNIKITRQRKEYLVTSKSDYLQLTYSLTESFVEFVQKTV